jgi:mono/diheme cytochrome c family protein
MTLYPAMGRAAAMRRGLRARVALIACCIATACDNPPAAGDDADRVATGLRLSRGHDYAQASCASCHAIEPAQLQSPNKQAPAFVMIASSPGMTAIALNAALHTAHASMPNLKVDGGKLEAVSEYILSLKDPALSARLRQKANASEGVHPLDGE